MQLTSRAIQTGDFERAERRKEEIGLTVGMFFTSSLKCSSPW
jgi:hypothetical protein